MTPTDRIAQLEAELARLKAEQPRQAANSFSPITLKKLADEIQRIRVNLNNIDLERQDEATIQTEIRQINYSSYTAQKAIEQDLTER